MKTPIKARILAAMAGRSQAPYYDIMQAVFPDAEYPRAWCHKADGGPPGCAMAFGAAVRRMGGMTCGAMHGQRMVWIPKAGEQ